jgi:hypothetical protein
MVKYMRIFSAVVLLSFTAIAVAITNAEAGPYRTSARNGGAHVSHPIADRGWRTGYRPGYGYGLGAAAVGVGLGYAAAYNGYGQYYASSQYDDASHPYNDDAPYSHQNDTYAEGPYSSSYLGEDVHVHETYSSSDAYASAGEEIAYCMRRYRSYDVMSQTFLAYDGRRHSCP